MTTLAEPRAGVSAPPDAPANVPDPPPPPPGPEEPLEPGFPLPDPPAEGDDEER